MIALFLTNRFGKLAIYLDMAHFLKLQQVHFKQRSYVFDAPVCKDKQCNVHFDKTGCFSYKLASFCELWTHLIFSSYQQSNFLGTQQVVKELEETLVKALLCVQQ